LLISDANTKLLNVLPRPFSTDANGNISLDNYILELVQLDNQKDLEQGFDRELNLKVKVDKDWLQGASYPVDVDPTSRVLANDTGVYDGYVAFSGPYSRSIGGVMIGLSLGIYANRGFIEFNTSSILDSAIINSVILNVSVNLPFVTAQKFNITRFNNSQISNATNYPDNTNGNTALFNNISTGYRMIGNYISNDVSFQTVGEKTFDLTLNASMDLQSQLSKDFFAMGLISTKETGSLLENDFATLNLSITGGTTSGPKLLVSYNSSCAPPDTGHWTCNSSCTISGIEYSVAADMIAGTACNLTIINGGNLSFATSSSKIYALKGSNISIYQGSALSYGS